MKKIQIILITFVTLLLLKPATVSGLEILGREELNIEESLAEQDDNFGLPQSILVTPIFLESDSFISDREWYQGLYYFETTRLNQGDFSFHYIVFKDGTVVKGNAKGEDQRVGIANEVNAPVVIAYLARKDDVDFDKNAKKRIGELILNIANKQSITLDRVAVKGIEFVAKPDKPIRLRTSIIAGRWKLSMESIIASIAASYKPQPKEYKLSVEKVELPVQSVKYGDRVVANITIKNNSEYALFQGTDFEPLISMVGGNLSKFYVNETWVSLTQAPLMPENEVLRPNESATYKLRIGVPLYFGEQAERFELINSLGQVYPGTEFELKINVERTNVEVIEILNTETGQLNVRANPSASAEIIARATPGQRFVVMERNSAGWVKIQIDSVRAGWVLQTYAKVV